MVFDALAAACVKAEVVVRGKTFNVLLADTSAQALVPLVGPFAAAGQAREVDGVNEVFCCVHKLMLGFGELVMVKMLITVLLCEALSELSVFLVNQSVVGVALGEQEANSEDKVMKFLHSF